MARVYCDGAVTVGDVDTTEGHVPPVVVGAVPQWHDESDGTYAEVETFEHPDVSFADYGQAVLTPVPSITRGVTHASVAARIRYQSLASGMHPPWVNVLGSGFTSPARLFGPETMTDTSVGAQTPTWVDIPLPEITPDRTEYFLEKLADGTAPITLRVFAPLLRTIAFRRPRTRIFAAHLVVTGPAGAPPCTLYPGGIQSTVGGSVTQFPPPKYRQAGGWGTY